MKLVCRYACGARLSPLAGAVSCPRCGGLLDPEPDLARLKRKTARQWKDLIEARASSAKPAFRSGVWRFQPWVLPALKADEIVTLGEGNAPLVEGPRIPGRPRVRLLVKLCGQQPTGSFKDLGMTALVSAAVAMRTRKTADVRVLVCASTGDTSAALAAYGARANIPVVVLLPAGKVSPAQLLQPLAHGAHVVEIDGDFDACMKVIQQVGARDGVLLANSKNPLRLLGQATVAYETVRDLGWRAPDVVVVPSGNLGNIGALYQGFSLLRALGVTRSMPRLFAAQVDAAAPFHAARASGYQAITAVTAKDTLATAIRIGDPVSFSRARRAVLESDGGTTSASEDEVIAGMRALDESGLLACPHTGAAMAGVMQLARAGELGKDDLVVLVSTASGLKFAESKARVTTRAPARARANERAVVDALAGVGVSL